MAESIKMPTEYWADLSGATSVREIPNDTKLLGAAIMSSPDGHSIGMCVLQLHDGRAVTLLYESTTTRMAFDVDLESDISLAGKWVEASLLE